MLNLIFAPAIVLMNRFSFIGKYIIVFILSGAMVSIFLYNMLSSNYKDITYSKTELNGIPAIKELHKTIRFTQQHRGLSSGYLGGNSELKSKLDNKTSELKDTIKKFESSVERKFSGSEEWTKLNAAIVELLDKNSSYSQSESLKAHTKVIRSELFLLKNLSSFYGLNLDPEPKSFYLMEMFTMQMPLMLEQQGLLRGIGTGVVAKKEINEAQKVQLLSVMAILQNEMDNYKRSISGLAVYLENDKDTAGKIKTLSDKYIKDIEHLLKVVNEQVLSGKFEINSSDYYNLTSSLIDGGYSQMFEIYIPMFQELVESRTADIVNKTFYITGSSLILLLLVAYVAIGTLLSTLSNFNSLKLKTNDIADGDLTSDLASKSNDEFDSVVVSVNKMMDSMNQLVSTIKITAGNLNTAAIETQHISDTIRTQSDSQSESSSGIAAAMQEMTVSIGEINNNAQSALSISNRTLELSEHGEKAVLSMRDEMNDISSAVSNTARIVEDLGKNSIEIGKVISVINDIANQINLLALNAAIEAARAGEAGRGFAVVADEVRKLAEKTSGSTAQISSVIGTIQASTSSAVSSMNDGVEKVKVGVALANDTVASMSEIQSGANSITSIINDIANSLNEQNSAANDISGGIELIAQHSEKNAISATKSAETVHELKKLSDDLQSIVTRFKTR